MLSTSKEKERARLQRESENQPPPPASFPQSEEMRRKPEDLGALILINIIGQTERSRLNHCYPRNAHRLRRNNAQPPAVGGFTRRTFIFIAALCNGSYQKHRGTCLNRDAAIFARINN